VHKKLRSKRLAPVLIKEVTRRVNRLGLFQAAYTAGVVLPKPVARCRYWHRSLNPKKLIDVGFSRLAPRMTMTRTIKLYALPEQPLTRGMRPLREADCEVCSRMLNEFLKQFVISPQLSLAEFKHWLMPQAGVVSTFVVEDPETKQITDMVSFYALPSSILGNDKHTTLSAAYSYYYFHTKTPLLQLMNDALVLAKRQDFDVFNALDILHNEQYLKELKFGIGDGALQYYLFNWRCPPAAPNQVGLVLL
jgi:glycylpeptide N-tetradecanoyltransferase